MVDAGKISALFQRLTEEPLQTVNQLSEAQTVNDTSWLYSHEVEADVTPITAGEETVYISPLVDPELARWATEAGMEKLNDGNAINTKGLSDYAMRHDSVEVKINGETQTFTPQGLQDMLPDDASATVRDAGVDEKFGLEIEINDDMKAEFSPNLLNFDSLDVVRPPVTNVIPGEDSAAEIFQYVSHESMDRFKEQLHERGMELPKLENPNENAEQKATEQPTTAPDPMSGL